MLVLLCSLLGVPAVNPYGPNSTDAAMAEYDKRRMADPILSPLGEKQASMLPRHPHLEDLHIGELNKERRVRVVTSPMRRAIETSIPLIKAYGLPKALLVASVCEKGGSYTSHKKPDAPEHSKYENKRDPGPSRAQLSEKWGATHDASEIYEDGWWRCPECPGAEQNDAFHKRLLEAKAWIERQVLEYGRAKPEENKPDYMIVVSHADFIDSAITAFLQLPATKAKYTFYSSNTAISHLEFELYNGKESTVEDLKVRIRGTNIKPVRVDAHELAIHRV
jgi:broad specificity phosphatase PhoE